MINQRPIKDIIWNVKECRKKKINLKCTSEELALDIFIVTKQLTIDIEQYLNTGKEAPAKRIRTATKIMDTLGRSFRVQSIADKKKISTKKQKSRDYKV